jgi:hypothetical protein
MALIRVLLVAVAIPFVGLLVSSWIISDINSDLAADEIPPARRFAHWSSYSKTQSFGSFVPSSVTFSS